MCVYVCVPVLCDDVVAERVEELLGPVCLDFGAAGAALLLLEDGTHREAIVFFSDKVREVVECEITGALGKVELTRYEVAGRKAVWLEVARVAASRIFC